MNIYVGPFGFWARLKIAVVWLFTGTMKLGPEATVRDP